jgi:hypothetical protein
MVLVQPILFKGQIHDGFAMPELFVRQLVQILGWIDPEFLVQFGEGRGYGGGPAEVLLSQPRRIISLLFYQFCGSGSVSAWIRFFMGI